MYSIRTGGSFQQKSSERMGAQAYMSPVVRLGAFRHNKEFFGQLGAAELRRRFFTAEKSHAEALEKLLREEIPW
jgi:hypothetical protein